MAGKKKKSLANKLAKMSDEERARYLQHRSEMEEEAKRRKEQLIATFMKKKIKKEESFSRLNMAKINQNWHQIMRKLKVKEMKDEVVYLKKWIERIMENKKRRISKLMDELEEAEEQYLNNFNSHSTHLDNIIANQNGYIESLQAQYQEELENLTEQAQKEENAMIDHANAEAAYLKTVIYGQDNQAKKEIRENWELYSKRLYEVEYNNRSRLRELRKTRGKTERALWQQILQVVKLYVQRTDVRRSHLQELRRMDAESAEEIRRNEERISKEEELIKILTINYEDILKQKTDKIKSLEAEEALLKTKDLKLKKTLKIHLNLDEKQLRLLIASSNETLNDLELLFGRGKQLLALSDTCRKFETEREKVTKWLPILELGEISEESLSENDDVGCEELLLKGLTDDEKLLKQSLQKDICLPKIEDQKPLGAIAKTKPRPKTSLPFRPSAKSEPSLDSSDLLSTPKSPFAPLDDIKIQTKKFEEEDKEEALPPSDIRKNILDHCYESLEKMENFWFVYNKAEIDVMELKKERTSLEKENKQLRGLIRAVLEAAALAKTIPDSRVPTRASSKRKSVCSAPLRRVVFN